MGAPTFVVHGPAGCGKSRFARDIAELLTGDPEFVVDGWVYGQPIADGHVHLTVRPPSEDDCNELSKLGVRVIPFSEFFFHETSSGIPPYEPETCGTHHLIAERALRILERPLLETVDAATVEALRDICSEAGVAFARHALRGPPDEIPF